MTPRGPILAIVGPMWTPLGQFGPIWGPSGALLGPKWGPRGASGTPRVAPGEGYCNFAIYQFYIADLRPQRSQARCLLRALPYTLYSILCSMLYFIFYFMLYSTFYLIILGYKVAMSKAVAGLIGTVLI